MKPRKPLPVEECEPLWGGSGDRNGRVVGTAHFIVLLKRPEVCTYSFLLLLGS